MSQTNNLSFYSKKLEKEEKTKYEVNRIIELIRSNVKKNKVEQKNKKKIKGTKNCFFEKIIKIAKPPHRLTGKKGERHK